MPVAASLNTIADCENTSATNVEKEIKRFTRSEKSPLLCSHREKHSRADVVMNIVSWCSCQRQLDNRKVIVDVFAILFGISAWIAVNGMYVQLPLLVQTQPEQWNLPSYLSVIVQVANIGPILYSMSQKLFPGKLRDSLIIYTILIMGSITLLLMAFLYKETTFISGVEHSTSLFSLVFFIALVGCTSSVLFMPFMSNFREVYLISYFVGEGLSGFLPSIVALVQGVGGNPICVNKSSVNESSSDNISSVNLEPYIPPPRFSSEVFFIFLFVVMSLSTTAFFLLNNLSTCKSEKVKSQTSNVNKYSSPSSDSPSTVEKLRNSLTRTEDPTPPISLMNLEGTREVSQAGLDRYNPKENQNTLRQPYQHNLEVDFQTGSQLSQPIYRYLLVLVAWVCVFGNGVFPSIQSFSCLPYGNVAYHLSVTLSSMANPVACFIAFFTPHSSVKKISVLAALSTVISVYIAATALLSPSPPLVGSIAGEALVVLSWVLFMGLISYVKVSTASLLRREPGQALFWCGAVQQMGSAIGATTTFFLVNYANIFHAYYPCQ